MTLPLSLRIVLWPARTEVCALVGLFHDVSARRQLHRRSYVAVSIGG